MARYLKPLAGLTEDLDSNASIYMEVYNFLKHHI